MATFDRSGFGRKQNEGRHAGPMPQHLLARTTPLAPWLEDPERAKSEGKLPLAPPSRPRIGEP